MGRRGCKAKNTAQFRINVRKNLAHKKKRNDPQACVACLYLGGSPLKSCSWKHKPGASKSFLWIKSILFFCFFFLIRLAGLYLKGLVVGHCMKQRYLRRDLPSKTRAT